VWIRLQRQKKRHMGLKVGIAYEGWERLPHKRESYRLKEKRVYVHGLEGVDFWEGASLAWFQHWDVSSVERLVLNGDDALWVERGAVGR